MRSGSGESSLRTLVGELGVKVKPRPILLRLGADVNIVDSERRCTPFLMACILEDEWTVKKFLKVGASLVDLTAEGRTALYIAAEKGNVSIMRLLHAAHGPGNHLDLPCTTETHRGTPLHVAAMFNNSLIVSVLIELGASLSSKDSRGRTPFEVARESNNSNVVMILEQAAAKAAVAAQAAKAQALKDGAKAKAR